METPMTDQAEHEPHHRTHASPMAASYMEFDMLAEVHRLKAETTWSTGQNARTLIKYDNLRVVLIALDRGSRMPEHQTDGRLTIQVMYGHLEVRASGRTFNLRAGSLLALDHGLRHDVTAVEESAILLTIAWPGIT
jgi:quercetin dioxygenase-like cupin family protein